MHKIGIKHDVITILRYTILPEISRHGCVSSLKIALPFELAHRLQDLYQSCNHIHGFELQVSVTLIVCIYM